MLLRGSEIQKVVAIASEQDTTSLVSEPENISVGGIARKRFAQQRDLVAELLQNVAQVVWDVMVKQELHSEGAVFCRAISKSISPRWSS